VQTAIKAYIGESPIQKTNTCMNAYKAQNGQKTGSTCKLTITQKVIQLVSVERLGIHLVY